MVLKQKTLVKEIAYEGTGLHSGLPVTMTLRPATADTGIVFVRTDYRGILQLKQLRPMLPIQTGLPPWNRVKAKYLR